MCHVFVVGWLGHRFCSVCALTAVKAHKCPYCAASVVKTIPDTFAVSILEERVRLVEEKKKEMAQHDAFVAKARELAKNQSEAAQRAREEVELRLEAEQKHREALEEQWREQEEMARSLAERQAEENRQLVEQLRALEEERKHFEAMQWQPRQEHKREQESEARRLREEQDRIARKHAQEHIDLSQSIAELRKRREAQDGAIDGQLEMDLQRSRAGDVRLHPVYAPVQNHNLDVPALGGQIQDGEEALAKEVPRDENASPLLAYSTAALRSISTAATSWSQHAWGFVGKLAQPLFSSPMSTHIRLGRLWRSSRPLAMRSTSGPSSHTASHGPSTTFILDGSPYVDIATPQKVRKVIPLPKYLPLTSSSLGVSATQNSSNPHHAQRITPEERNRNAEYFYCFREAMILSLVNHPHILRFQSPLVTADRSIVLECPLLQYDAGFYAAEMLVGNAEEVLERIRTIITHVLLAVHYLHSLSVYHLNIKPSAILIHQPTQYDPIVAQLSSFSKARARGSHDSFVSTLDLSDISYYLPYMSPQFATVAEAARLRAGGTPRIEWSSVDIWAVGCTLIALLARGCDLFAGVNNATQLGERANTAVSEDALRSFVATSMRRRRRPTLSDLAKGAPQQFNAAIRLASQMLATDPNRRLSALDALRSPFIALNQDIIAPTVRESFDDEALPTFALLHKGVPNRTEILQPED